MHGLWLHMDVDVDVVDYGCFSAVMCAEWGDWLASQKQMEAACTHYTECGAHLKVLQFIIRSCSYHIYIQYSRP